MKRKKEKRKKLTAFLTSADDLLAEMMRRKPNDGGEDLWLFSIVCDDPERPTWYERLQILGPYEVAAQNCAAVVFSLPAGSIHRIEARRGQDARRCLLDGAEQENKYRREIAAQPNN